MVKQAEQERQESGFNFTPQQEFPEVGDQQDRDIGYVDGNPTQRNFGWYDFTPSQRYVMIVLSYASIIEAIDSGTIGQLDDETLIVAGFAPYDVAAKEAGDSFAISDQYNALAPIHELMYGDGVIGGDLASLNIPKINVENPEATFNGLYSALGGIPLDRAVVGMSTMIAGSQWGNPTDPYTADNRGMIIGGITEFLQGEPEATAADLLSYVNRYASKEDTPQTGMILQNAANRIAPVISDLSIGFVGGGVGVAVTKGAFGLAIKGLQATTKGAPVASTILRGLTLTKKYLFGNNGRYVRRTAQAVGGAYAVGRVGSAALRAAFETNEESMAALTADITDAETRNVLSKVYYEMDHPVSYALRNDPNSWYNQRQQRRQATNEQSAEAAGQSKYGYGGSQPGPQQLREGYSYFNPEVRKARKDTTVEEMGDAKNYGVKMYQTNTGWELR